ncbi:MAG: class I SAM-dependent methyltransferase [Nitrospirales bacterium]|nr:class I SAM-dependent methyltransferase [Nitrospira sp.]MDR4500055.1 class I SAM-dependent methyltransferase [Nitrospirales bacterium]
MITTRSAFTRRTIEAYEQHQSRFLRQWNTGTYKIPPHMKVWMSHLSKDGVLLDLGCGAGQDARYLRRQGFSVYGVDLTWSFLQAANKRDPRLPLVQADMWRLPFLAQTFDGIWAAASVIHLSKVSAGDVFKKLWALTKPGGWLAITVMYGRQAGVLEDQWIPGRYLAKWFKAELSQTVKAEKWEVISLDRVENQERKGAWLNLLAKRPC